jgi:hypothetical protein
MILGFFKNTCNYYYFKGEKWCFIYFYFEFFENEFRNTLKHFFFFKPPIFSFKIIIIIAQHEKGPKNQVVPPSPPPHLTYLITVLVVGAINQWTKPQNVIERNNNQSIGVIPMGTA